MLTINGLPKRTCAGITRRELLQVGGAGLLGLCLPKVLAAEGAAAFTKGKAKSVIFLFLFGGPSQLETFDMKPDAPSDIRGPFRPIKSRTPDLLISEHLQRLAKISDKFGVIRTMTHSFNDHSGAGHYIQTGKRWHIPIGAGFNATSEDWPSMGSVVEYLSQHAPGGMAHEMPAAVVLPNSLGRLQDFIGGLRRPGEYAGWLGKGFNPMTTVIDKRGKDDNPYWRDCTDEELTFQIEGLSPLVPTARIRERANLLDQFEAVRTRLDAGGADALDIHRKRALALVATDRAGRALNIRLESDQMRDRYGRHLFGQSCLMARRLVEAGTRFVTVHYDCVDGYSWDSHRNSDDVRDHLLPTFDQACAALLIDLDERGLLDETLVVAMGEMGRTPTPTKSWGRGHWSTCFPALLAGGGIRGGIVYGQTDRKAEYPTEHPVTPEDLAKTIYWALGIDPELFLTNREGRPIPIVESGKPLVNLFG
jgi:uncharacterized protein (DUF1501 family)